MLRWVDLSTLYLIDAITCVAADLGDVPTGADAAQSTVVGARRWGFGAVLDGFRYLAGNRVVLMSFVVDLIAMIFGMPRALFPQMAHESFGGPIEGGTTMALLAAAMSVGAVAGGLFSGWLPRVRRQGLAVVARDRGVGAGDGRLRCRRRFRRRRRGPVPLDCVGLLGDRRRGGHGVGGFPLDDPAAGGLR